MTTVMRSVALPAAARACSEGDRSGSPNGWRSDLSGRRNARVQLVQGVPSQMAPTARERIQPTTVATKAGSTWSSSGLRCQSSPNAATPQASNASAILPAPQKSSRTGRRLRARPGAAARRCWRCRCRFTASAGGLLPPSPGPRAACAGDLRRPAALPEAAGGGAAPRRPGRGQSLASRAGSR